MQKIPVTVLSGFLGAGKTTLLNYALTNQQGMRIAVIVNDISEVLIDSKTITNSKQQHSVSRVQEKVVEMANGCICCSLREDLLVQVRQLAEEGNYDYILIEGTGIAEPIPIAETFTFELTEDDGTVRKDDMGRPLSLKDVATLDTIVTVVDGYNFLNDVGSDEALMDRNMQDNDQDERTIAQLLIDQVEFANIVVINKRDLISKQQLHTVEAVVKKINPNAKILYSERSKVPLEYIFNTGMFNFEEAQQNPGWLKEMRGAESSEQDEYGISSFVYRRNRPFHPARLEKVLSKSKTVFEGVLRSKGFFWNCTSMEKAGIWGHAGGCLQIETGSPWWCEIPQEEWPKEIFDTISNDVQSSKFGDRKQEIVFMGQNMNKANINKCLDNCLLTDAEFKLGPEKWEYFDDPMMIGKTVRLRRKNRRQVTRSVRRKVKLSLFKV